MTLKTEIVSIETIKASSPTPNHLRHFKISLLDQLAPPTIYIPIVLFYSASDINEEFQMISHKLKTSLSHLLTLYYPFCGRLITNLLVECNDEGVIFIESKVPTNLSHILTNPQVDEMKELFPFNPYNPNDPSINMGVQLNQFSCGGIGLGVCFSHKIADGTTAAVFLNAWASIAKFNDGEDKLVPPPPQWDAALLFPPRNIEMDITRGMVGHKNIVTKRFIFNATNLSRLREKFGSFNPTRVEAVTALIWKSALEAAKASSEAQTLVQASMVSHAVNIRNRMEPPLSKHAVGNLWQQAISSLVKVNDEVVSLLELADIIRNTVKKIDADYIISKLQGDGFPKIIESIREAKSMIAEKGIPCYSFSSWARFAFYGNDFGWGKPTFVCPLGVPIKNVIILMATKDGDGIEAWVTLTKLNMVEFESNPELLQFTFI
ncbi:hypothetical protein RIF29_15467 [Crotalaria pallida]|uniref:Uncharacterized protein n=1 Tax=Crotalaria pallida TaxID=3830 RepID=A0AAN9FDK4_CROPI